MTEKEVTENLKKCSSFDRCSQNLCPLDFELSVRAGADRDKCKFMRETRKTKAGGKEFITGGALISDAVINFVPESNVERLNTPSKQRRYELHKR